MPTLRLAPTLAFAALWAVLTGPLAAQWNPVPVISHPSPRTGAAMTELPPGSFPDGVMMFGGTDGIATLGDYWRWTGADWLRQNTTFVVPSPRYGSAFASLAGRVFLFGGATGPFPGTVANDLWEVQANSWAPWTLAAPPPPRAGHVFVGCPSGLVLFGGRDSGLRNDTWRLDLPTMAWSPVVTAASPSPRADAAACYDAAHNGMILFGGDGGSGNTLGDTWLFDGVRWLQQSTAVSPPPRRSAAMTFDSDRGRVLLVGGLDAQGAALADTWEWLGSQWVQRIGIATPAAGPAQLAHHTARGEDVLVFAGASTMQVRVMTVVSRAFASEFGSNCGANQTMTAYPPPTLGTQFRVRLFAPAFGCIGFSRTQSASGPLPQPILVPGLTRCQQLIDVSDIEFVGSGTWSFGIPNLPGLQGLRFYLQGVQGNGATLHGVSNGLECQFGALTQQAIDEPFDSAAMLDRAGSAGDWGNGFASFGQLGGDGRHGEFHPDLGSYQGLLNGKDTYLFQTDNTFVPAAQTLDGQPATITDGQYFFTDMVVPANVRLVFAGSSPPRLCVRGRVQIDGDVDVRGRGTDYYVPPSTASSGQAGGAAGPFAGSGGNGGDKCLGNGANISYSGRDGGNSRVLAGHAYAATTAGTGGRGSSLFPTTGMNSSIVFGIGPIQYCIQAAAGGGGGGNTTAGGIGQVLYNNHNDPVLGVPPRLSFLGPQAPGGTAVQLFPLPPNARSSAHFLVGGAGGGGAGSHALFANNFILAWTPGNGGGGGGGAIALQAGDALLLGSAAQLLASGGACGRNDSTIAVGQPQTAPGGAGAGGAVVLQSGRVANLLGIVDVRGGAGGYLNRGTVTPPTAGGQVEIAGGDGAPGVVRFEMPGNPTPAMLPGMLPLATSANVGPLTELSDRTGFQSRFYASNSAAPAWQHYEIEATINGVPVRFSDDPGIGQPARFGIAPIAVWFQGAQLDPATGQPLSGSLTPWRTQVRAGATPSLGNDPATAVRFVIVLDRTLGAAVVIDRVRIVFAG